MRRHSRPSHIGAVVAITAIATIAPAGRSAASQASAAGVPAPSVTSELDRPHLIDDRTGDVVVRIQGHVCSGTPITGTVYVVTAAHCVLNERGDVVQRTVVRDHVWYPAVDVLVDTRYHDRPSEALDAAVLVMARPIPGPSVRVGADLPDSGSVTLAGLQPLDSDGSLLRGRKGVDAQTALPYEAAGCVDSIDALNVSPDRVIVPCGLVRGGSGGGLYAEQDGELVLVGILSTVMAGERANGVVPLASLQELLAHPDRYAHGFHAASVHDPHNSRSADVVEAWSTSRTGSAATTGGDPVRGESDDSYFARTGRHLP